MFSFVSSIIAFLENTCFEVPKFFTVSSDFTDFSNVIVSHYACAGLFKYPLSCHETKPQSINVPAYVLAGLANECKRWEVAYHLYNPERIVLWLHFETVSHSVIGP